ncbi:hypothetical protein AAU61_21155 [Desulfocarbo indianensis]|nr:hypothetical protein AAU61_21155 [Desulfocarbo indianensis]
MTAKPTKYKWSFPARFRARSFGWRSSRLACQRLREAVSEIKKVARKDPVLGGEGAVKLMEKIWPALEQVDSSSGALGAAVNKALDTLVPLVIEAPAGEKIRARWLERLWQAIQEDGVDYLAPLCERWGEVCGTPELASTWADGLMSTVKLAWSQEHRGYFVGTTACLSCLLTAGRNQEVLDLLELAPFSWWHYRVYGMKALLAMGKKAEALKYARASGGLNDDPTAIALACEEILRSSGLEEEAYQKYALPTYTGSPGLATFRAVLKRFPERDPNEVFADLVEQTPSSQKGKWFATAKHLGLYDLALRLVQEGPTDPRTLNRAARDFLDDRPDFALGAALASLTWMAQGYGYDLTQSDAEFAASHALNAAGKIGVVGGVREKLRALGAQDQSMHDIVRLALAKVLPPTD